MKARGSNFSKGSPALWGAALFTPSHSQKGREAGTQAAVQETS